MTHAPYIGEGRGAITRDGCAVELYLKFPYRGELQVLSRYLPAGCSVLELGCGTGRLTRPLLGNGCRVTAVDNSADMLRYVPREARKVRCDIERLRLDERFDLVLLASGLINIPDEALRRAQLEICRGHLAQGGHFVFQRYDPAWFRDVQPGPFPPAGDVAIEIERVVRRDGLTEMSVLYTADGEQWRHHFTARLLDDDDVRRALNEAGFATLDWIDARWGAAR